MRDRAMDTDSADVKVFRQAPHKQASDPTSRKASLFGRSFIGLLGVLVLATLGLMVWHGEFSMAATCASYLILLGGVAFYHLWRCEVLYYEIRKDSVAIVRAWPSREIVIPVSRIVGVSRPTLERSVVESPREGWWPHRFPNPIVRMPSGRGTVVLSRGMWSYHVGSSGIELFACVTSAQRLVAIECEDRSYLISPERPDEFVRDIRAMI